MSQNLSTRRKADRAKMATTLADTLRYLGAEVVISPEGGVYKRTTSIQIGVRHGADQANVTVRLDGTSSQPDIYVFTWNAARGSCFSWSMGDINPYHFGKVNVVCYGFDDLLSQLSADVVKLTSGQGFSDENLRILEENNKAKGWPSPRVREVQ